MTLKEQSHFYWLDWLRFIAAFMVVSVHSRGSLWVDWGHLEEGSRSFLSGSFFALTRAGTEWVLVFFVLSGFLVGGKLIERIENRIFDLKIYVIDRVTRIWVPLIPAMAWAACIAYITGKSTSLDEFFGSIFGLQGVLTGSFGDNLPLWSLSYEIWFYFLAGCLAVWVGYSSKKQRVIAGLGISIGLAVFTKLDEAFLFSWIFGALTYWLYHEKKNGWLLVTGGALMVIGYILSQLKSSSVSVDLSAWIKFAPSGAIAMLIFSFGIAIVLPYLTRLEPANKFGKKINELGISLAAFSYTLYLTHYPSLYLWEHFFPQRYEVINLESLGWYVLRVSSCILLGWLLYLPFEKKTRVVRRYVYSRISTSTKLGCEGKKSA